LAYHISARILHQESQVLSEKEADLILKKKNETRSSYPKINNQLKSSTANEKEEEIKNKPMHGKFYQDLESPSVDEKNP